MCSHLASPIVANAAIALGDGDLEREAIGTGAHGGRAAFVASGELRVHSDLAGDAFEGDRTVARDVAVEAAALGV